MIVAQIADLEADLAAQLAKVSDPDNEATPSKRRELVEQRRVLEGRRHAAASVVGKLRSLSQPRADAGLWPRHADHGAAVLVDRCMCRLREFSRSSAGRSAASRSAQGMVDGPGKRKRLANPTFRDAL